MAIDEILQEKRNARNRRSQGFDSNPGLLRITPFVWARGIDLQSSARQADVDTPKAKVKIRNLISTPNDLRGESRACWRALILDDAAPNLASKWPDKNAGLHTARPSGAAHRFSVGMPSTFIPAMGKGIAAGSRVR
jgi:hypothetical protein